MDHSLIWSLATRLLWEIIQWRLCSTCARRGRVPPLCVNNQRHAWKGFWWIRALFLWRMMLVFGEEQAKFVFFGTSSAPSMGVGWSPAHTLPVDALRRYLEWLGCWKLAKQCEHLLLGVEGGILVLFRTQQLRCWYIKRPQGTNSGPCLMYYDPLHTIFSSTDSRCDLGVGGVTTLWLWRVAFCVLIRWNSMTASCYLVDLLSTQSGEQCFMEGTLMMQC